MNLRLNIILFVLVLFCVKAKTQNLIPNPSLDYFSECPKHNSEELYLALPWDQLVSTVDYYHTCDKDDANGVGRTCPGTVGIHLWWGDNFDGYREYFGVKLSQPLLPLQIYYCEFWVKNNNSYKYASDDIGVYITNGKPPGTDKTNYWNLTPHIENTSGNIITSSTEWTKICGTYTATGGEDYLVYGCFKNEGNITLQEVKPSGQNRCYYYFDDFYFGLANQIVGVDSCKYKDVTKDLIRCKSEGMYLPNVFTPNDDSKNDYYFPIAFPEHEIESYTMTIYNRWGNLIATVTQELPGWNGKINGKEASLGVYYAVLSYTESPYGFKQKNKSFFYLFR